MFLLYVYNRLLTYSFPIIDFNVSYKYSFHIKQNDYSLSNHKTIKELERNKNSYSPKRKYEKSFFNFE
jgi:hypothetical protein